MADMAADVAYEYGAGGNVVHYRSVVRVPPGTSFNDLERAREVSRNAVFRWASEHAAELSAVDETVVEVGWGYNPPICVVTRFSWRDEP